MKKVRAFLTFDTDHKIDGIKWLRQTFSMGLKEAKDALETGVHLGYLIMTDLQLAQFVVEQHRESDFFGRPPLVKVTKVVRMAEPLSVQRVPTQVVFSVCPMPVGESDFALFQFANGWYVQLLENDDECDSPSYITVRTGYGLEEPRRNEYAITAIGDYLNEVSRRVSPVSADISAYTLTVREEAAA